MNKKLWVVIILLALGLTACGEDEKPRRVEIDNLIYVEEITEKGIFTTKEEKKEFLKVFYTMDGEKLMTTQFKSQIEIGEETYMTHTDNILGGYTDVYLSNEDYIKVFGEKEIK